MKKLLVLLFVCVSTLAFWSCASDNSPKGVAAKAIECIQDKDYTGYVDLMYFNKNTREKPDFEEGKKQYATMLEGKVSKEFEKKEGIKSYEILSEEIAEDGESAVVKFKLEFGNGETKDSETMKMRKGEDGKWLVDAGK